MKRRYLRPWVQNILMMVVAIQMMMMLCLDDFAVSPKHIMLIVLNMLILAFNLKLLSKYGRSIYE